MTIVDHGVLANTLLVSVSISIFPRDPWHGLPSGKW